MSSGNKYHREIHPVLDTQNNAVAQVQPGRPITVDVYSVLDAFKVSCPARQHAIKKLLCAGLRGKGDCLQDLVETRDAVTRAIELESQRQHTPTQITY